MTHQNLQLNPRKQPNLKHQKAIKILVRQQQKKHLLHIALSQRIKKRRPLLLIHQLNPVIIFRLMVSVQVARHNNLLLHPPILNSLIRVIKMASNHLVYLVVPSLVLLLLFSLVLLLLLVSFLCEGERRKLNVTVYV